jgi:hypothetical protein
MTKNTQVFDHFGNEVKVGDKIMFIEQDSGRHGYKKASFGQAIVEAISPKTLKLQSFEITDKNNLKKDILVNHLVLGNNASTLRKTLNYLDTTFFKI